MAKERAFWSQKPLVGKGPSKAKTFRRQMANAIQRQSVNCTTVTSEHPLYSQSHECWYGWVRGYCITREFMSEDVAAVKVME
jgi:hypothetical protein